MSRFAYVRQPLRKRILRRRYLLGRPLPQPGRPRRTICAYARRMSRFSRVKVHYPDWVIRGDPPPAYDLALASELLTIINGWGYGAGYRLSPEVCRFHEVCRWWRAGRG
jgi:hypothetical protein